jgi:hypothetical protein
LPTVSPVIQQVAVQNVRTDLLLGMDSQVALTALR